MREYTLSEKLDLIRACGHLEKTDALQKVSNLINIGKHGRVIVLCGPEGAAIMAQILTEMDPDDLEKNIYIDCHDGDRFDDLCLLLRERRNEGSKMAFVDEITKTTGFIRRCSTLHDFFTRLGFPIVMSGSDPQLFRMAEERELFDRVEFIDTTQIF